MIRVSDTNTSEEKCLTNFQAEIATAGTGLSRLSSMASKVSLLISERFLGLHEEIYKVYITSDQKCIITD